MLAAPAGFMQDQSDAERLFELNIVLGIAVVYMGLGGLLVFQAASSLGGVGSTAVRLPRLWPFLIAAFVPFVLLGQWLVNEPSRAPWLFPFINLAIVVIPSLLIASYAARRYGLANPLAWPVSWREWMSGFIYGAIGATTIGALINTAYLVLGGALFIHWFGTGDIWSLERNLPTVPTGWGVFFDLSILSIVAPLNEEFWKGMLVALFFFRKGNVARCFLWGILAGAGFNLIETFQNSLGIVNPEALREQTISSDWWRFAIARAGTGIIHATATGFAALGIYALLRRRWRWAWGYPAGVLIHGSWNFLAYIVQGDVFLSRAGPDSDLLDGMGIGLMILLASTCAVILWTVPRRFRDERSAPLYAALGMSPSAEVDQRPAGEIV